MFGGKLGALSAYRKAIVALGGAFGTFLVTILAEQHVTHVLPPTWVTILGLAGTMLTGFGTYKVRNIDPDPTTAYERARAQAEQAQAKADQLGSRLPTPGDVVDQVIDTARGTINRWL